MPDDDLTPVQRSVLLVLMAEARQVPNAYLTSDRKLELAKARRDDLERRGLIKVEMKGRRVFVDLTERGWRWCRELRPDEVPPHAGHGGSAAYTLLAGIQRYLDRHDLSLPEFFSRLSEPEPSPPEPTEDVTAPTDVEARIRKAYEELAPNPGAWVKLADLRPLLGGVARSEQDQALVKLNRTQDVSIVPESNQKVLMDRDHAAAVRIGNQFKHLIAIGPA